MQLCMAGDQTLAKGLVSAFTENALTLKVTTMRQCEVRGMLWGILILAALHSPLNAQSKRTQAQKLVDSIAQRYSEITGLELSATPAGQKSCMTIAATQAKDLGEKCDKDEEIAMKTGEPFVEHEPDGFDVTAPLHDASGKLIGALGIDFKPLPGQTKADVLKLTARLLKEVEQQIPSKTFLFQPVSAD